MLYLVRMLAGAVKVKGSRLRPHGRFLVLMTKNAGMQSSQDRQASYPHSAMKRPSALRRIAQLQLLIRSAKSSAAVINASTNLQATMQDYLLRALRNVHNKNASAPEHVI